MLNILLIEDTDIDARVFQNYFDEVAQERHNLSRVKYPREAEKFLLGTDSQRPDLIILDIGFNDQDMTGLQFLKQLKTKSEYKTKNIHLIPVVILTASNGDHDVNEAYAKQASAYFVKPVDGESEDYTYRNLVTHLIYYWQKAKFSVATV